MVELEYVKKLFEQYFKLEDSTENLNPLELKESEDYRNFLAVSSEINNLVLTGEEVLDLMEDYSEIIGELEDRNVEEEKEYKQKIKELRSKLIGLRYDGREVLEKKLNNWKSAYKKLKKMYKQNNEAKFKLSNIEKIINGKQGRIIEDIKGLIRRDV